MYIISHLATLVRVFSVLPLDLSPSWDQLPNISTTCSAHCLKKVDSPYVMEIRYPLLLSEHPSLAQYWGTEFCYWFPFSCRLGLILESSCLMISIEIYILLQFSMERMSPSIQSVQNILTCTGRAPH